MQNDNKIVLYIMTGKGYEVLRSLLTRKEVIEYIVIGQDKKIENDFSSDIENLCKLNSIKFFHRGNEPELDEKYYVFSISWRWMIEHPQNQLIVFHDSILPKYRGFAPLVNMLINGEDKIGVSAIFGASEYDKGEIIAQKTTNISYPIKISEAIEINNVNYLNLVEIIVAKIANGEDLNSAPQDESQVSYSIWRDHEDYYIDWTKSADEIKRLIDAIGYPYLGARSRILNGYDVVVEDAEIFEDVYCELRHVGKVIFVEEGMPVVICGSGLLKITKASYMEEDTREPFLPMKSFRLRFI